MNFMSKPLSINLPVLLQFGKEVEAFRKAKDRIEELGSSVGVPIEVGAFSIFMPKPARTEKGYEAQFESQKKNRLPIRIVETGIYGSNALSYTRGSETYKLGRPSNQEDVLDQTARLRDLDQTAPERLVVAPHIGIFVSESVEEGNLKNPALYSVQDFLKNRKDILDRSKETFTGLEKRATELGLRLALEMSSPANYETIGDWENEQATSERTGKESNNSLVYKPFEVLRPLMQVSGKSIVLDAGHIGASRNIETRFTANDQSPDKLFEMMNVSSWGEFNRGVGTNEDYLPRTHGIHISPTDGIGVRLEGTEEGRLWGDGTGQDLTSMSDYMLLLRTAIDKDLPIAVEPEFNFKPSNGEPFAFKEADAFLEPILKEFAKVK
jgi:hypothetical protein